MAALVLRAIAGAPDQLQTIYGICGERPVERMEGGVVAGYEGSKPVNVGNAASTQFQLMCTVRWRRRFRRCRRPRTTSGCPRRTCRRG